LSSLHARGGRIGEGEQTVADVSRRALLTGCGAACLSVLVGSALAGCGGGEQPAAPAPPDNPTGAGADTSPTGAGANPSPTGSPSSTAGSPAGPAASPTPAGFLTRLDEVPVGGGVIVNGAVLVVQPTAGAVKAFDARCPHAGFIVGTPNATGVVTCPGHLAHYRAADGSLIDGPSPSGLRPVAVRVSSGAVLRA